MNSLGKSLERIGGLTAQLVEYFQSVAKERGLSMNNKDHLRQMWMELMYPGEEVTLTHRQAMFADHKYRGIHREKGYWVKLRKGRAGSEYYTTLEHHPDYIPPNEKDLQVLLRYFNSTRETDQFEKVKKDLDAL